MKRNRIVLLSLLLLSSCSQQGSSPESQSQAQGKLLIANESCELSLFQKQQIQVSGVNLPEGGLSYSSSDPSVIVIDEQGVMTALKEGVSVIKAYCQNSPSIFGEASFSVSKGDALPFTYHDFDQYAYRGHSCPSLGEVNILVLPVTIEGFEETATQGNLAKLDQAFNSSDLERFESVSSYYEKSSYGQLKMNFTIPDQWFSSGLTPEELQKQAWRDDLGVSRLSLSALDWYKETYPEDDIKKYDSDKDGFVDGIWMIYSAPVMGNDPDKYKKLYPNIDITGFWAYTLSNYVVRDEMANLSSPVAKMVCWAGLDFMDGYGDGGIDAHTYIHETGHMLGLKDYYSTYSPYDCPAGSIDMMDNNIGDHCAFSKFALGWSEPIVVTEPKTFFLPSFQDTGEFLLISSPSYNNTPFDEYFTLEFLTPTCLNKEESSSPYPDNGLQGYSKAGVRISHIDNRVINKLAEFESDPSSFYNDPISNTAYPGLTMFLDETGRKGPLYQNRLMQKDFGYADYTIADSSREYFNAIRYKDRGDGEKTRLQNPDGALFYTGDSFSLLPSTSPYRALMPSGSEKLDKYKATNDPEDAFPYLVEVGEISEEGVEISISLMQ